MELFLRIGKTQGIAKPRLQDMFESAGAVIIASLPKDLDAKKFRRRLYNRTYGEILPF
jgi:hypothetical protein